MLLSLMLLGSVGILMASLADGLDDEEVGSEGDGMPESQDFDEELDGSLGLGVVTNPGNFEFPAISNPDMDYEVELEGVEGQTSDLPVPESPGIEDPLPQSLDVFTLDLTSAVSEDSSEPLADFNSNPNTPILNIDEIDYINIDLSPEDGSIGVLRADYFERSENADGSELESLHTGVNLYFIPNGETFPDDYEWSEDSANLYNEQSYINDNTDFGEIRLILRVDTGFLYSASSYAAGVDFSDEMFERLEEAIIGNDNFHRI